MIDHRTSAVETWLRSGASVCPFARTCVAEYVEASAPAGADRRLLVRAAREFSRSLGASPSHALITLGPYSVDHESTYAWAIEAFLGLNVGFAMVSGVPRAEAELFLMRNTRPLLLAEADPTALRPHLRYRDQPLFTFCMAPCYPRPHPRFAPFPILVTTWALDVAEAQKSTALVTRIRERMKAEHGFVYDADALVLPLPEAPARSRGDR